MMQPSCDTVRDRLPLAAAGAVELSDDDRSHLRHCTDCAEEWRLVQRAAHLGDEVVARIDPSAMAGDVLERLRAEPSVVPLTPRRWWAAGLVAAAALIALVLSPVFRGGPTGFETGSEVAWFVPELDSLETAELLLVLNTFDGAAGADEVIGLPLEDDLETQELEQVLQAWEG